MWSSIIKSNLNCKTKNVTVHWPLPVHNRFAEESGVNIAMVAKIWKEQASIANKKNKWVSENKMENGDIYFFLFLPLKELSCYFKCIRKQPNYDNCKTIFVIIIVRNVFLRLTLRIISYITRLHRVRKIESPWFLRLLQLM